MTDERHPLCPSCGRRWPYHSARTCSHLVPMPPRFRDLLDHEREAARIRDAGQEELPIEGMPP